MKGRYFLSGAIMAALAMPLHSETVVLDFEGDGPTGIWKTGVLSVEVTNAFATSGHHGLHYRCVPWKNGMYEWPSFNIPVTNLTDKTNWTGYDRVAMDVVSLGDADGETLNSWINGSNDVKIVTSKVRLPSRGWTRLVWKLPAKPSAKMAAALTRVERIHVFVTRPSDVDVVIDRVTLLREGEELPPPSGPLVGRDIVPMLERERSALAATNAVMKETMEHLADYALFCNAIGKSRFNSDDMAIGTATSMEKVRPRGGFSARAIPDDGLRVRLARNECESLQIVVAPKGRDLKGVRVAVDGDFGTFPSSNIVCEVVGFVNLKAKPPYKVGYNMPTEKAPGYRRAIRSPEMGWWPDPLLGFLDVTDIAGTDVQSFWVRVSCPEGQPAGEYSGALLVTSDGVEPVRIPLHVRVNDFDVGRKSMLPLMITFMPETKGPGTEKRWHDPLSPMNAWRRHKREWGDFLADYYVTMDSLYHKSTDYSHVEFEVLERLRSQGRLGHFNLGYWGAPNSTNETDIARWAEKNIPRLRKAYDEAKARGLLDHAYVYGCDELSKDNFPRIAAAVRKLKSTLPGVPIATTAFDESYGMNSLLDEIDWFTPGSMAFDQKKVAASRAAGHQVWWYICCEPAAPYANMFIECPAIEGRLLMGAQTQRMKPDGFLYYQLACWMSERCIESGPFTGWNPVSYETLHGDGSWVCAGPDGIPLPTIRLENFRDGLEDYAYAKILEAKLREVESGKLKVKGDGRVWLRRAKALLAVPRKVMDTMTNYTDDPAVLYRWRDAMADLIEEAK